MPTLFFSYSHQDERLRDLLEVHLAALKRQGVISTWHDRRISAGTELGNAIDQNLNEADVILLLISPDFINSDYCYEREMLRAIQRHDRLEARVIPIILRPCDWHSLPFGELFGRTEGRQTCHQMGRSRRRLSGHRDGYQRCAQGTRKGQPIR